MLIIAVYTNMHQESNELWLYSLQYSDSLHLYSTLHLRITTDFTNIHQFKHHSAQVKETKA